MRCHFLLENWSNGAAYATKVLASSQLTSTVKLEAQFALGISSFHVTKYEDAKKALQWVADNSTTAFGAEARYTLAEIAFAEKDMAKTDEAIKNVLAMKPAYDYWIAKSILLQAKVFIEKGDLFQAEQSVNTVLANYPHKEDGILSEAKQQIDELTQLKAPKVEEEAPVPTEVAPEIEIDETVPPSVEDVLIEIQPEQPENEIKE
jgi:predicted Zn-dependent protease